MINILGIQRSMRLPANNTTLRETTCLMHGTDMLLVFPNGQHQLCNVQEIRLASGSPLTRINIVRFTWQINILVHSSFANAQVVLLLVLIGLQKVSCSSVLSGHYAGHQLTVLRHKKIPVLPEIMHACLKVA